MRIVVTAGPTREAIDPVRFLSNRSTGRMGYGIASAAAARGHEVTLVTGPTSLRPPDHVQVVNVVSAAEMLDAVKEAVPGHDAMVMAAAVSDWRPAAVSGTKLKKAVMDDTLRLERTGDILQSVAAMKERRIFVGFCAETGDPVPEARRKLASKGLDLVVANDVSLPDSGFEVETNRVTFVSRTGEEELPLLSKQAVAARIIAWIEDHAGLQEGERTTKHTKYTKGERDDERRDSVSR